MNSRVPVYHVNAPYAGNLDRIKPGSLVGTKWIIRASSGYDDEDPTLPLVHYHAHVDNMWGELDSVVINGHHWIDADFFIEWVERSRGMCDRCGIVLPVSWDRDQRWSWRQQINETLQEHGREWRIREALKLRSLPRATVAVYETVGLLDLIQGTAC